jgi:hypothetical protein
MELLTLVAIVTIIVPIVIGFAAWLKKQRECTINTDQRTLRIAKALYVLANRMDDINEDQHGKKLNLGPEMKTILQDNEGNF